MDSAQSTFGTSGITNEVSSGGTSGTTSDFTGGTEINGNAATGAVDKACEASIAETDADGNPLIHVLDANNYSFQGRLTIPTIRVKSSTNLSFDWSEITQDLRGRDLDPLSGVDQLRVVLFQGVTEEELVHLMSIEGDLMAYVYGVVFVDTENAVTSANLLDLHPPAGSLPDEELLSYVDTTEFLPEEYSYAALLGEGTALSAGFLMITYIRPDPNETNTEVNFTNDSTQLDYTVDLTSLQKMTLPAGVNNITMKWTDGDLITTTATGNDFKPTAITDVMIGHYPDMTPSDLENHFLDVDGVAETIWTIFLSAGTSVSLANLQSEKGDPFPGINDQGTWIFALRCGSCTSPVPWFLTVLQPCPE